MKTSKAPSLHLGPAFISLATQGILLDPVAKAAIATDGEAIAIFPIPEAFDTARLVSAENAAEIYPDSGEPCSDIYDLSGLENPAAYRIALNPAKLAHLARALDANDLIVIELPSHPSDGPIKLYGNGTGYLMPQPMPDGHGLEGLLVETGPGAPRKIPAPAPAEKPQATLPAPVVTIATRKESRLIEVNFGGKPDKEILQKIGRDGIGFSYSGQRGTKKGVPPCIWYAPDNEFFRMEIKKLLGVEIQQAAA